MHCDWFLSVCKCVSVILPRLPALCRLILGFYAFIQPTPFQHRVVHAHGVAVRLNKLPPPPAPRSTSSINLRLP
eukprot:10296487-Alexandrium_andersonii.AAC.1